jgi:hypothetical protein
MTQRHPRRAGAITNAEELPLSTDRVNEQAASLLTHKFQVPYRLLNPWIIRVGEVVEHHNGPVSEHRAPGFYLTYGVVPGV